MKWRTNAGAGVVRQIGTGPGNDSLVGGLGNLLRLVRTLMEHHLVDEYRLMVFPLVLGRGKRLFGEGSPTTPLELIDARPVGSQGVLVLAYRRAREEAP